MSKRKKIILGVIVVFVLAFAATNSEFQRGVGDGIGVWFPTVGATAAPTAP